jgi:hypothetical protein
MAKRPLVFFLSFSIFQLFPGSLAFSPYKTPTLELISRECLPGSGLPWSEMPTCFHARRLPWTYPGSRAHPYIHAPTLQQPTLERTCLPWTYPGAETPALPRLPGRLPRRTWPFSPSSSSLPAALPPPPPRAPQGPRVSQKTPAPRLPWSSPWTLAGPLEGAANGRATWAAGFGLAVQFSFSAKRFRMGNRPNRLTAPNGQGEPTLELPWSPRARTNADERRRTPEAGEGRDAYPGAGDRPTLHLPAEGRSKTNQPNQTHQRTPTRPPEGGCVGEIEAKYGLPSADRNNKATLLLTGPFRTAKSSAKDLTPLVLKLQYAKYRGPLRGPRRNRLLRH